MLNEQAMLEMQAHEGFCAVRDVVYNHGVKNTLLRLAEYVEDNKEAYALRVLAEVYEEREREFCEDAPTMS